MVFDGYVVRLVVGVVTFPDARATGAKRAKKAQR